MKFGPFLFLLFVPGVVMAPAGTFTATGNMTMAAEVFGVWKVNPARSTLAGNQRRRSESRLVMEKR